MFICPDYCLIHLDLIFEKSSLKDQVEQTWFFFFNFELDFYCLCKGFKKESPRDVRLQQGVENIWMFCLEGGFFSAHWLRRLWLKGAKIQISLNYRSVTLITWQVRLALCTLACKIQVQINSGAAFFKKVSKNVIVF